MEIIHFEIKNLKDLFFIEKRYRKDEIKTHAVIQKENVPEAPILWYYMLKEKRVIIQNISLLLYQNLYYSSTPCRIKQE